MNVQQREELWIVSDALDAVAKVLGVEVEALIEDPSLAVRDRDAARAALAKVAMCAEDMRAAVAARRFELQTPRPGGQSCGPRGGPLIQASPGVLQDVSWWARALDEAIGTVPAMLRREEAKP